VDLVENSGDVGLRVGAGADLVGRGERVWEREAAFDRELMLWMTRFAFSTVSVLSECWGVSEQRMRARVRRLEAAGLVQRRRDGPREPARVVLTERGGTELGLSVRTARAREPLGHELAIIERVIAIERHFAEHGPAGARVLTERDMRRAAREHPGRPWTVGVIRERGRRGQRWADYAVETPEGRTAVERRLLDACTKSLTIDGS
jgi:DNA-binding MarR family transcriptional regulator